ncbi:MAG: mannosyltransferase family protein [Bacteroidales bacterium]
MSRDRSASSLPVFASVLDALTVVVASLGLLLEITGGPRFHIFGVLVSLRGGTRLLALAALLAAVRHVAVRQQPLHGRLAALFRRISPTPFLRHVLPSFIVTRLSVLLVGYVAALLIAFPVSLEVPRLQGTDEVSALTARWDAIWLHDVALQGYRAQAAPDAQANIAFFPAYPLLMRWVSYLVGGRLMVAGLLVSLAAFLGALTYLFAFARQRMDEERAGAAVLLLASYPFSVYYGAVYTESLFLLAALGALYHASRRELVRSGAWALVAGLTRPNGCLLSIVLAALALEGVIAARTGERWRWLSWDAGRQVRARTSSMYPRLQRLPLLVVAFMPIAGMLLFSAYVSRLTGDPFAWMRVQEAWGRHFDAAAGLASGPFRNLVEYGVLSSIRAMPAETLNSLAAAFAVAAIWPVWRRFGLAMALFVVLNLGAPLAVGGVMAIGRYTCVLFPIFLWLGATVPALRRPLWVGAFAAGQALIAVLFFTWRPLF